MQPAARDWSVTFFAANARSAGVGMVTERSLSVGYSWAPSSGIRSGFAGTSFAISNASFAAAASDALADFVEDTGVMHWSPAFMKRPTSHGFTVSEFTQTRQ